MKRRTLLGVLSLLPVTLGASGNEGRGSGSSAGNVEVLSVDVARHLKRRGRLRRQVERLVRREVAHLELTSKVALSTSLLELETQRRADLDETRCVVSAVVHARPSGDIRAILRGQCSVRTEPGDRDGEATALEAAIAGALRKVPGALGD
jgi:hypothetical protein